MPRSGGPARSLVIVLVVALLGGAAGAASATGVFADVEATSPFAEDIAWVQEQGIASGYDDGTFRPDNPVSRGAMAAFLHRYAQSAQPTTVGLTGPVATIHGNSGLYVFAGPPAFVTTTTVRDRVTGVVSAPMGLVAGAPPQLADTGFCYQPASGGVLKNFVGSNFSQNHFTAERQDYAATATVVLAPGTYNVGMCVRNNGSSNITNNNFVQGWVTVTA